MLPLTNRIADQLNLTGGLNALLEWDNTIMDGFTVPEGVDRDLAIATILMRDGNRPLMHPSPELMKHYIKIWSDRLNPIWKKLLATTMYEYNAINNYNRTDEITETRNNSRTGTLDRSRKVDIGYNEEVETNTSGEEKGDVSAENTDEYQPDTRSTTTGNSGSTLDSSTDTDETMKDTTEDTENGTTTTKHHSYGNIGVTTTQKMIIEERGVVKFSIYDVIESDFVDEFCLLVW